MTYLDRFKVAPGSRVKLGAIDPGFKDQYKHAEDVAGELERCRQRLGELQELLFVNRRPSLLICLQAMDTGGKDGTIAHVMNAMNPQGCRAVGFRLPSLEEAAHDFLWRVHRVVPAAGEVVIFNRSHYEEVLVARVHHLVPEVVWSRRYDQINAFEDTLADHETHILKFYLHISKDEQLQRLRKRLDDPTKQWKVDPQDYIEREHWDEYMAAYEDVLNLCSRERAPWFVIPANHKWFRNLAIARILVDYLEQLHLTYPPPPADLEQLRREHHAT